MAYSDADAALAKELMLAELARRTGTATTAQRDLLASLPSGDRRAIAHSGQKITAAVRSKIR